MARPYGTVDTVEGLADLLTAAQAIETELGQNATLHRRTATLDVVFLGPSVLLPQPLYSITSITERTNRTSATWESVQARAYGPADGSRSIDVLDYPDACTERVWRITGEWGWGDLVDLPAGSTPQADGDILMTGDLLPIGTIVSNNGTLRTVVRQTVGTSVTLDAPIVVTGDAVTKIIRPPHPLTFVSDELCRRLRNEGSNAIIQSVQVSMPVPDFFRDLRVHLQPYRSIWW